MTYKDAHAVGLAGTKVGNSSGPAIYTVGRYFLLISLSLWNRKYTSKYVFKLEIKNL